MSIKDNDYKPVSNIPLRSPVAIGGFFLHFLRQRFSPGFHTEPWVWDPDITKTGIIIETGQTVENEVRNKRPAIYVLAGPSRAGNLVVGDKVTEQLRIETKDFTTRVDMNMTVNCESSKKTESHLLGWICFSSLIAAQEILRTKYHIANIGPFNMNPPVPGKKDKEMFVCGTTLGLSYDITWKSTAVQTFIKSFDLSLNLVGDQPESEFFTRIYLESNS